MATRKVSAEVATSSERLLHFTPADWPGDDIHMKYQNWFRARETAWEHSGSPGLLEVLRTRMAARRTVSDECYSAHGQSCQDWRGRGRPIT